MTVVRSVLICVKKKKKGKSGWLVFIPSPSCLWREESAFLSLSLCESKLLKFSVAPPSFPFSFSLLWIVSLSLWEWELTLASLHSHLVVDMEKVPSPWISMPLFLCPERPSPTHLPSPQVLFSFLFNFLLCISLSTLIPIYPSPSTPAPPQSVFITSISHLILILPSRLSLLSLSALNSN